MAPSNTAAWLTAKYAVLLEVKPAPYTPAGQGEIVIRNRAIAINPIDWAKQLMGNILLGYLQYPAILGGDVAGQIVDVGPGVERFRIGDRVLGSAIGITQDGNRAAEGAFQLYTVVRQHLACQIPPEASYEQACVVPLALTTAAHGLFHPDYLNLDFPSVPARPNSTGKAVIITGGASSVGSNAIQLAVAAGYEIYSTCSAKNADYVRGLGATRVYNYHSPTWTSEMAEDLNGKPVAGAYTVGHGSVEGCSEILRRLSRDDERVNKLIVNAGSHLPADQLRTSVKFALFVVSAVWWLGRTALTSYITGVKAKLINITDLSKPDSVVGQVYTDFLPRALSTQQFTPAPSPLVVGEGLEKVQEAMDVQAEGVSAQKVVVSLSSELGD